MTDEVAEEVERLEALVEALRNKCQYLEGRLDDAEERLEELEVDDRVDALDSRRATEPGMSKEP